jgi:FkbM family methyltransferase
MRFAWRNGRFAPYVVHKDLDGVSFDFLIGDVDGQDWYAGVDRLSSEMIFLRDMVAQPGDVVLECGAHHGFFTILLAHWVGPEGHVVAFEASPKSAAFLAQNIARNGLEGRVTVEAKAVGSAAGSVRVTDESNAIAVTGAGAGGTTVPVAPLDAYESLAPTLLKLDVEGFEIEILKGARRILEHAPKLAIEVHVDMITRYGARASDLFQFARPEVYDFWLQKGAGQAPRPYAGEDLNALHMNQVHLYALPKARAAGSSTARNSSS